MYMADWQQTIQPALINFDIKNKIVIFVLIATNKTILIKHKGDIIPWPVYSTIGNLNYKISKSQIKFEKIIVNFISIHNADFLKVKIEIYYLIIKIITKSKSNYIVLQKLI